MYLKYFSTLVLLPLVFIGTCSNTIEVENLDYIYIKGRIDGLEYAYEESLLSKLDTLKRLPRKKVEDMLKEVISNPKDDDQLSESIFYAGILELKSLKKTISSIHSFDLHVTLSQDFYYSKINQDKERH